MHVGKILVRFSLLTLVLKTGLCIAGERERGRMFKDFVVQGINEGWNQDG